MINNFLQLMTHSVAGVELSLENQLIFCVICWWCRVVGVVSSDNNSFTRLNSMPILSASTGRVQQSFTNIRSCNVEKRSKAGLFVQIVNENLS